MTDQKVEKNDFERGVEAGVDAYSLYLLGLRLGATDTLSASTLDTVAKGAVSRALQDEDKRVLEEEGRGKLAISLYLLSYPQGTWDALSPIDKKIWLSQAVRFEELQREAE